MGATQMHLKEIKWQTQWQNGVLLLKDTNGDIWQPNPAYGMGFLRQMREEARIQILWGQAAMHRHGTGMESASDMTLVTKN
eukprot:979591-Karenia_brevis.AAC.1